MKKTSIDKLRILLPHWIEHNLQHAGEFRKWVAQVREEGHAELAGLLEQAVATMVATDSLLDQAAALIGTLPGESHAHPDGGCCHGHHDHHGEGASGSSSHHHPHDSGFCCPSHQGEKK